MEIALIIILLLSLYYSFKTFKRILETQTRVSCKILGLKVYDQWRANFKYNPKGGVEHFEPLVRWDPETDQCLLAVGYKSKIENEKGWEYEVVWEVFDVIHGNGNTVDQWHYGTASPDSTAGEGNMKKTKEEIEHDDNEKKRGEKILLKFHNAYYSEIIWKI